MLYDDEIVSWNGNSRRMSYTKLEAAMFSYVQIYVKF